MFADNFDVDKQSKPSDKEVKSEEEKKDMINLVFFILKRTKNVKIFLNSPISQDDVVQWEFRWENKDDAEVHGPHSTEEMLKWQDSGFFDKGVFVRKIGRESNFVDGRRIDFDLYT